MALGIKNYLNCSVSHNDYHHWNSSCKSILVPLSTRRFASHNPGCLINIPITGFKQSKKSLTLKNIRNNLSPIQKTSEPIMNRSARTARTFVVPVKADQSWSLDFMSESLSHGRTFQTLKYQ